MFGSAFCKKSTAIQHAILAIQHLEFAQNFLTEQIVQNHRIESPLATSQLTPTLLLRMPTVMRLTGLARSTIYKMIAEQTFPTPVRIGTRAVAWRQTDLERWSAARPVVTH